jgi:hypothetical protein
MAAFRIDRVSRVRFGGYPRGGGKLPDACSPVALRRAPLGRWKGRHSHIEFHQGGRSLITPMDLFGARLSRCELPMP